MLFTHKGKYDTGERSTTTCKGLREVRGFKAHHFLASRLGCTWWSTHLLCCYSFTLSSKESSYQFIVTRRCMAWLANSGQISTLFLVIVHQIGGWEQQQIWPQCPIEKKTKPWKSCAELKWVASQTTHTKRMLLIYNWKQTAFFSKQIRRGVRIIVNAVTSPRNITCVLTGHRYRMWRPVTSRKRYRV